MSVRIVVGDALEQLRVMQEGSTRCCVTSPPYFGLRDYGVSGQIGLEATPDAYVSRLVEVFREVRRVLADDGTLWLNLGDSYARGFGGGSPGEKAATNVGAYKDRQAGKIPDGMKGKDLIGIPWMVAFALRADGWYLRSDIIWSKPNPMPESVTDRPTKAHEYVFLLAKSERYYYDADALREPGAKTGTLKHLMGGKGKRAGTREGLRRGATVGTERPSPGDTALDSFEVGADGSFSMPRNKRSVWEIAVRPFVGAHFATMPPELARFCISAGSREGDTILDPFGGAGTTGLVADRLGRNAVLIELNPEYATLAKHRLTDDAPLFTDVTAA